MTEKELISKIKLLKEIKPREDWVVLAKNRILNHKGPTEQKAIEKKSLISSVFKTLTLSLSPKQKLVYSFASLLIVFVGALSLAWYSLPVDNSLNQIARQPAGLLLSREEIKKSVEELKIKSQELAAVKKNKENDFSLAVKEVEKAINNLATKVKENPKSAKEVAIEVKNSGVLAALIEDEELSETSIFLNKTLVEQTIVDLESTSLTEKQGEQFEEIKDLYRQERYSDALEKILLINN